MPSNQTKIIGVPWSFRDIWNQTLDSISDRPLIPRDYCYASELGGSFCDRYLAMNAVPYSNPPNIRSRRKFQAGNTWEWIVGMILVSSGVLKKKQVKVDFKLPRLLSVHGRLDFIAGGDINWDEAKEKVKKFQEMLSLLDAEVPPFFFTAIEKFIDKYKGQLLAEFILELKAISSYMMEKVQKTGAMPHQVLQKYHYLKGDHGIDRAKLIYICKDDCILEEFTIVDNDETFQIYRDDIKQMTKYYNAGFDKKNPQALMPPKEKEVLFETGTWRFTKNWKVEYSKYLTMLYGYETPEAYGKFKWQRTLGSWNRVFKRCVRGDNMTDNNKKVIAEAIKAFPQWDKYVKLAKADGAFQKPEEQEDEE